MLHKQEASCSMFSIVGRNSFAVHRTLFPTSPPECRRPVDTRTTERRRERRVWIVVALATFIALPNSHGFLPDADDASGSMVTIRTSSALVRGDAQQLRHITRYIWHNRSFIYNCSRSDSLTFLQGVCTSARMNRGMHSAGIHNQL
jgi:hypothetical protein